MTGTVPLSKNDQSFNILLIPILCHTGSIILQHVLYWNQIATCELLARINYHNIIGKK